jgi:hypothetical protein
MSDWGERAARYAPLLGTASGSLSATPGSNNVSTAWQQMIAATPEPIDLLHLSMFGGSFGAHTVYDIATGSASNEDTIIDGLYVYALSTTTDQLVEVPVPTIPAGTRLAWRVRTSAGAATAHNFSWMGFRRIGNSPACPTRPLWNAGLTRPSGSAAAGTAVAAGTTWVQLTASTPSDCDGLILANQATSDPGDFGKYIEVAIGAVGSEEIIWQHVARATSGYSAPRCFYPIAVPVPKGSRIAVRNRTWFGTVGTHAAVIYGV